MPQQQILHKGLQQETEYQVQGETLRAPLWPDFLAILNSGPGRHGNHRYGTEVVSPL